MPARKIHLGGKSEITSNLTKNTQKCTWGFDLLIETINLLINDYFGALEASALRECEI